MDRICEISNNKGVSASKKDLRFVFFALGTPFSVPMFGQIEAKLGMTQRRRTERTGEREGGEGRGGEERREVR